MTSSPIRVLIAEDHAVVREGTRHILECDPDIRVVGEAEDGQQALDLALQLAPDMLVLDLRLPLLGGVEVTRRLSVAAPDVKVLVLSAYDDDDYIFAAMAAGAAGYLLKTARGDEVVGAIHGIIRGEVVLQSAVAEKFFRYSQAERHRQAPAGDSLTTREMEILRLAALGMHNKDIARRLQVSPRTVEGHLSHVFEKLSVHSRTEAILHGAASGWFVLNQGQ